MSEFRSKDSEMPPAEAYAHDVRGWIADVAQSRPGPRKAVLAGIARETGLNLRRIAAHFYGEVKSPSAAEYEQLRRWRAAEAEREMVRLRARLAELDKHVR